MNTLSRTTASSPEAPATRIAQPVTAPSRSLYIKRGTPQFIQLTLALFSAGLATLRPAYLAGAVGGFRRLSRRQ